MIGDTMATERFSLLSGYFEHYYQTHPPVLRFQATSPVQFEEWRLALRLKIWELLGVPPIDRVPLAAHVVAREEEEAYWREKITYTTAPGITAVGYLLTPKSATLPRPAVLCPHGHGVGKEATIQKGTSQDYAVRFAEHGFITFTPDHIGFGDRSELFDDDAGRGYRLTMLKFQLLGQTVMGWRVWDLMRALDLLAQRPEVQADRIGCVGLSLGGELTLYLAALDDRVKVALISGFLNTLHDTFYAVEHCNCGYVPGILKYAEMGDIAALIAPRPLLIESGKRDTLFPTKTAQEGFGIAQRAYALLGAVERIEMEIFDGGHAFSGRKAFDWFERWL